MSVAAARHVIAFAVAAVLVFALRIQDVDLQRVLGPMDQHYSHIYTPYFPGLAAIHNHEIFAPENDKKKKIVFLGASAVDAIGCDTTWQDTRLTPAEWNIHYSCSVAGQMNDLLAKRGYRDWKAFDLARNGTKLTPMLYVYAQILALKPDIVIWGETYNYYDWENADADALSPGQYALLDRVFGNDPETAATWASYKLTLRANGWIPAPSVPPAVETDLSQRYHTSINDILLRAIEWLRVQLPVQGIPKPLQFKPDLVDWASFRQTTSIFDPNYHRDDPGFGYFQGFGLIATKQREIGKRMFFYFSPQYFYRNDTYYKRGLDEVLGGWLTRNAIPFRSYVSLPLIPVYETVDGVHNSIAGNRKLAEAILNDLEAEKLLAEP